MDKGHISIQINHIGIVNDIKENYLLDQNLSYVRTLYFN